MCIRCCCLWSLMRLIYIFRLDSHLVVSTVHETVVFELGNDNDISRVDAISSGFVTHLPTLATCNISRVNDVSSNADSPFVVQVTQKEVILLEFEMSFNEYTQVGEKWTPDDLKTANPREIVAASVNPSQIVLGLSGVILVLLNLSENNKLCRVRQAFCSFATHYRRKQLVHSIQQPMLSCQC